MMLFLQTFRCGQGSRNVAEEVVSAPFTPCWSGEHIVYTVFAGLALVSFAAVSTLSFLFFSIPTLKSPLPWADQPILARLTTLTQKLIIACSLVFDPFVSLSQQLVVEQQLDRPSSSLAPGH